MANYCRVCGSKLPRFRNDDGSYREGPCPTPERHKVSKQLGRVTPGSGRKRKDKR